MYRSVLLHWMEPALFAVLGGSRSTTARTFCTIRPGFAVSSDGVY